MQGYNVIAVFNENADRILCVSGGKIHIRDYLILSVERSKRERKDFAQLTESFGKRPRSPKMTLFCRI